MLTKSQIKKRTKAAIKRQNYTLSLNKDRFIINSSIYNKLHKNPFFSLDMRIKIIEGNIKSLLDEDSHRDVSFAERQLKHLKHCRAKILA